MLFRSSHDSVREAPEDTFVSSQERRKMWKDEWTQSALPNVPELKGWHVCWLSTSNSYDSIDKRIRVGYRPVKCEEIPGFENYRVKAGDYEGYIACNEMILFKIPEDIYQEMMTYYHHEAPFEEAEKIKVNAESVQQQMRDSNGKSLGQLEGDGLDSLDKPKAAPIFR